MALETVVIKITGDSKDLNKTIDQLEKVGKVDRQNAESFKKTSKQMGSGFDGLKKKAMALGATMLGAFAIQQVVGNAINTLKNFEKELSTLQSITGSTAKEMEFFKQAAKDVGQETKTSATEVVKAFTMIGSAQPELLKNSKALAEVTKQALILSKAAGIDATSAATALTSAMNQFGVSADDAAKFTDIFATSQQKGSSFIADTSEALINSGAAAAAAGLSFETTNAAIQALAKGAIVGARAGTALRGVLSKLSAQSDDKINPSMVGLGKTITELSKRNLTLKDATKLVGEEGATGLLTLIKQKDIYFELDGTLNDVGNAMAQMEINTNNLDGSLDELNRAWEGLMLSFGDSTGVLKGVTDSLVKMLDTTTEIVDADVSWWEKLLALTDQTGNYRQQLLMLAKAKEVIKEQQEEVIEKTEEEIAAEKLLAELEKNRAKTIGDLKKELKELREAQNALIPGSRELAKNQARIKEIQKILKGETKKVSTEFELLQKVVSKLKKELLDQALAGDLDEKTLAKLKDATDKLTKAQEKLNDAVKVETDEDIAKKAAARATAMNKMRSMEMDIDEFVKQVEDENQRKRDENFNKRVEQVNKIAAITSDVEGQLSAIIGQANENKLIGIDNEEKRALEALEAQGLGEEELAKKKKEIQEKAEKERAKILTKQFKADKAGAIIQATIATSMAVIKALSTGLIVPNIPFGALMGALGAAQIATIAAQPIPEFHEGKKAELKDGEIFAKVLKSESVIPPEQSKKYKGAIDSMIDKKFENYVFQEYMLPMMKSMSKKDATPYDDVHLWNNQKKQIRLMQESNGLTKLMIKTLDHTNSRRSWNG